jgi:hypothetical protein
MRSFKELSAAMKRRTVQKGATLTPAESVIIELPDLITPWVKSKTIPLRVQHDYLEQISLPESEELASGSAADDSASTTGGREYRPTGSIFPRAARQAPPGSSGDYARPSFAAPPNDPPNDPPEESDLELLRDALQTAAALEFATIPPYLVALWSVIDQDHVVAHSIRSIVHEEMLHLVLVNNMLAAVGGTPTLTGEQAPTYPSRLPGGVHPHLVVHLEGLTDRGLDTFLEIERPRVRVQVEGIEFESESSADDQTIGEFYRELGDFFRNLAPTFSTVKQVSGPLAPMVITSLDDVDRAIAMIMDQGEGATGTPVDSETDDLAHYYRFLEVKLQRRLVWQDGRLIQGDRVIRPSAYPIAPPPKGGHTRGVPPRIQSVSREFNSCYTSMLHALESAWGTGGHVEFVRALELMFELRPLAQEMMRTPGPDGRGYTPEFRLVGVV